MVRAVQSEIIEQLVGILERREPLGILGFRLDEKLAERIRTLRGRLHKCSSYEWGPVALQAQEAAPPDLTPSVSYVRPRRTKTKERQGSVARSRSKKTRRRMSAV
jgi:hypothetical protein